MNIIAVPRTAVSAPRHGNNTNLSSTTSMSTNIRGGDATSIDEYIEMHRGSLTASDLKDMRRFLPGLARKAVQAEREGRRDLVARIDKLMDIVNSSSIQEVTDPLPQAWAELGVAARYLLKGVDIIPDFVKGIGLSDDEWIVRRVMERNPGLTEKGSRFSAR